MKKLVFATHNHNKLNEVQEMLGDGKNLQGLYDIGCKEDIIEDGLTLEDNAKIKANYVFNTYGISCFADDTGLEVEALDGAPGVISARYAGEEKNAEANMNKLLENLHGETNRNAQFRTVIYLKTDTQELLFVGICKGQIISQKKGTKGFGYDPIFIPDGYDQTFAELSSEEKNKISHRGLAFQKLVEYLSKTNND